MACCFSTTRKQSARFYEDAEEAVKDIPDNSTLLVGGNLGVHALAK